jgi:isopropylmalate/homocitrate/citramalate synthase
MKKPKIFTPEEIKAMRHAINKFRHPGAYEQGKWMVSYLNRKQDVVNGHFPEKVILRDITLRTTEQMPGVVATEEERRRLLREIVKVGVPEVQTSAFGRGHTLDEMRAEVEIVKEINPKCQVVYEAVRSAEDLELAAKAGVDAVQFEAPPWSGASMIYSGALVYETAWEGKDWRTLKFPRTFDETIERAKKLFQAAEQLKLKISAGINMLPYADEEYVKRYCQAVGDAGPYEILLFDGPSGLGPEAYGCLVRLAKQYAPKCQIAVHPHNMFNLATANALASVREGAKVIEVSVNGYCAASGQTDLAHAALALTALYDVDTGIDLGRLTSLARMGEELTGYHVAWNCPVTGPDVFNWGGMETIIQEMKEVDPLVHWNIEPTLVGNVRKWSITRDSGPYAMWDKLDELGIDVERNHIEPILQKCLALIQKQRRAITDDQIREIAFEVKSAGS